MKKKILVLAVLGLCAALCSTAFAKKAKNVATMKNSKISFENENGSLFIANRTNADLVIFAGNVEKGCVLGGVKAGMSRAFDLTKVSGLPKKDVFIARAVTYDVYKEKVRMTSDDVIYTGFVVYDLDDANKRVQLLISEKIDVKRKMGFYVSNESQFFTLELRLDSPNGEAIAVLPPLVMGIFVPLEPSSNGMPYSIYPVYKLANSLNEIISIDGGYESCMRISVENYPSPHPRSLRPAEPSVSEVDLRSIPLFNE